MHSTILSKVPSAVSLSITMSSILDDDDESDEAQLHSLTPSVTPHISGDVGKFQNRPPPAPHSDAEVGQDVWLWYTGGQFSRALPSFSVCYWAMAVLLNCV